MSATLAILSNYILQQRQVIKFHRRARSGFHYHSRGRRSISQSSLLLWKVPVSQFAKDMHDKYEAIVGDCNKRQ